MIVKTGFGYLKNSEGNITDKYCLPAGEYPLKSGYVQTEVANQEELDLIEVWKITPSSMDTFNVDRLYADINASFQSIGTDAAKLAAYRLSSNLGIKMAMEYRFKGDAIIPDGTRNFYLAKQFLLMMRDVDHSITDDDIAVVKASLLMQGINLDDF